MESSGNRKSRSSVRHFRTYTSNKKPKIHPDDTRLADAIEPAWVAFTSLLVCAFSKKPIYIGVPLLAVGILKKHTYLTMAGTVMSTYDMLIGTATKIRERAKEREEEAKK